MNNEEQFMDEELPAKTPRYNLIQQESPSKRSVVTSDQAELLVMLIERLERSALDHFQIPDRSRIPLERFSEIWELEDYRPLILGAYSCGFVCRDMKPEFDLNETNRDPSAALGNCSFPKLRQYVHTLMRGERWADGNSSPIMAAIKSGALALVATRLTEDETLRCY